MKIPFTEIPEAPNVEVVFEFFGESCGSGTIALRSEGGGAFVEIKSEDGLRLNADEVVNLGVWATQACMELDAYNREGAIE